MDEKILEEKKQLLLLFCKLYQDYGREMVEVDSFISVRYFLVGLCNRALALNSGFYDLTTAKCENYLAAIPLIRLMLDNAMTGYAFFMAGETFEDRLKYIHHIREGKEPHSFTVSEGKTLNERTVIAEMNKGIKGIKQLYKKGCSYIHYSKNLLESSAREFISEDGKHTVQLNVNDTSGTYTEEERIGFWDEMIGANCYMMTVIVKWDDYFKNTIVPIIDREFEKNKEAIMNYLKEQDKL